MHKLFCFPSHTMGSVDLSLISTIDLLTDCIDNPSNFKKMLLTPTQFVHPITTNQVFIMSHMCVTLRCCYLNALREMKVGKRWEEVVTMSLNMLDMCGINTYKSARSAMKLHRHFRQELTLPHPNKRVRSAKPLAPHLFHTYPEAESKMSGWCSQNLSSLSCSTASSYIHQELIPFIYELHKKESSQHDTTHETMQDFTQSLHLGNIHQTTVSRWLKHLGFQYKQRKKHYFNDKHESPSNVNARNKFITTYFEYERCAHHWVHVPESSAVELEQIYNLPRAYHEFTKKGELYRQYHVDTNPVLFQFVKNSKMGGDLSVLKKKNERPIIIIGQDETIFKQYSFSSKTWHSPEGCSHLIPKSDGYTQMVSAYVARPFGLGIHLSSSQLGELNKTKRRRKKCVSKESAMNVHGTTTKPIFNNTHLLVQYFNVGVNEEGYWSHDHMVLQNEDAYDVLSYMYPLYDFVDLMDQSTGHRKRDSDALHAPSMCSKWGGSQPRMHPTAVKEIGPHPATLQPGDTQCMVFRSSDKGPFYMETPNKFKHTRETDETIKQKKTKEELLSELKKKKGYEVTKYISMADIVKVAQSKGIRTVRSEKQKIFGWCGQPKGLIQVLWERGLIDIDKLSEYSISGKNIRLIKKVT